MRKRVITLDDEPTADDRMDWLDLASLAQVEVTSEDAEHPIEAALAPGRTQGWRAAAPGRQIIRLFFDAPQTVGTIQLCFREETQSRSQEFLLRWAESPDGPFHDLLRQGFHFSPPGTTEELENYQVKLAGVRALELSIVPEVSGAAAVASLARWRVK